MADWYVFQHDGAHLGPWSTQRVANAILTGELAPDVWVAAPGGPRWLRARDVPLLAQLAYPAVSGAPKRRESGLQLAPGFVRAESAARIGRSAAALAAAEEDIEALTPSWRTTTRPDDERDTEPWLPPSSSDAVEQALAAQALPRTAPAASGGPSTLDAFREPARRVVRGR